MFTKPNTQTSEVHTVKLLMGQPERLLYNMLDNTTCQINESVLTN